MALNPRSGDIADRHRNHQQRIQHLELRRQPAAGGASGAGAAVPLDDGTIGTSGLPRLNNARFTVGHTNTNGWGYDTVPRDFERPSIYREGDRVYWQGVAVLQFGASASDAQMPGDGHGSGIPPAQITMPFDTDHPELCPAETADGLDIRVPLIHIPDFGATGLDTNTLPVVLGAAITPTGVLYLLPAHFYGWDPAVPYAQVPVGAFDFFYVSVDSVSYRGA